MLLFKILILQLCINLLSSFQLHHWVGNNMRKSIKGLTKQAGICIAVTGISLSNAPAVLNLGGAVLPQFVQSVHAEVADQGANTGTNTKIKKGGASTLQQGISKTITRGVNLDGSDFSNQRLRGVAFQQSIVRDTNFKGSDLYSASFFDATLDGSNFEDADMTLANVELAQFNRANFKNTIAKQMYVVGGTNFKGLVSIENSDWTDTELRADQRLYLCGLPTAKGTNPVTKADTRESLMCD